MLKEKKKVAWEEEGAAMGEAETETLPAATYSQGQRTSQVHRSTPVSWRSKSPCKSQAKPSFTSQMETGGDTKWGGAQKRSTDRRPTTEKSGRRRRHCEEGMEQEVG